MLHYKMARAPRTSFELNDVSIKGFGVGIGSDGPVDLTISNVEISGSAQPFNLAHGSNVTARSVAVTNDPKLKASGKKGWTAPQGPPLPIYCPACKKVARSRNYTFSGGYFWNWGSTEECPHCLSPDALLSEGVFDLTGETLRIISAPDFTYAMHQALAAILADVRSGATSSSEAIDAVKKVSPTLGTALWRAGQIASGVLALALAVISAYYTIKSYHLAQEQTAIAREGLELQKSNDQISYKDKVRQAKVLSSILSAQAELDEHLRQIEASLGSAPHTHD